MPRLTLLDMTQDIPKSTLWARKNKDRVRENDLKRKGTLEGKLISLVTQSRYRAKEKGLLHNVDVKFLRGLYEYQKGLCALSGIVMSIRGSYGSTEYWHSISIDRIDSTKGYTSDNVQLLCTGVNKIKGCMSDDRFIMFCKGVVENKLCQE